MGGTQSRPGVWVRAGAKATRIARRVRFLASVRHIHGPRRLTTRADDVIVVALVKNGVFYLDDFFDHYRAIGARHFVFFDNGSSDGSSSDGTIARIAREPGTIIVQSRLPWGQFENDFRRHAAQTYCANRWCLFADMDEMFDFEGSDTLGLTGLVRYLRKNDFTALVAQMLEMFPKSPLRQTASMPYAQALDQYRYFDLGEIVDHDYHDPQIGFGYYLKDNTLPDPRIKVLFGGVRRKVFGEVCCLTKHPLVFVGPNTQTGVHPHCSAQVDCADFSALIRHYKFTDDPLARDSDLVATAAIDHGEDRLRVQAMRDDPDLSLYSPDSILFTGVDDLYARGFLIRSEQYSAYVAAYPTREARGD